MLMRYWQPFREIETIRRQLDRALDDLTATTDSPNTWVPAIELKDAEDHLILRAQLPGIDRKDLDVQVTREAVSISGEHRFEEKHEEQGWMRSEFRYGKFQRVIPLPVQIQNDQVKAEYKDGILTLTLPKVVELRNKTVKVNLMEPEDSGESVG